MEKRILGKTGLAVSVLAFGGFAVSKMESKAAGELVKFAVENGINYFDVAPSYGDSQYVLGAALAPYRKDVYLASKTKKRDANGSKAELLESLSALKTDYFDNFQFHSVDSMEEVEQIFSKGGAFETVLWALEEGLTRNIGFSAHEDAIALEMLKHADFDTVIFPVNFAYREIKGESTRTLEYCVENNVGVVAIKALAERGWLDGEEKTYPRCWYKPIYDNERLARIALNYTLTRDGVVTAPTPSDERMLRLAVKIIKSQNGRTKKLGHEDRAYLHSYIKGMNIEDLIF